MLIGLTLYWKKKRKKWDIGVIVPGGAVVT
jgi:hypothetical protein